LDRWLLSHQATFENIDVSRGICRIYAIFINEMSNQFYLQAGTGAVIKIKQAENMVISTLSIRQCSTAMPDYLTEKPILLCSFGNLDLVRPLQNIIRNI